MRINDHPIFPTGHLSFSSHHFDRDGLRLIMTFFLIIPSRQNNDDRHFTHGKSFLVISMSRVTFCWYIPSRLSTVYSIQVKNWTSVISYVSYYSACNVLIASERKKERRHVSIFPTLYCLHIYTSYWDLSVIHSHLREETI
jgi:hypothetical protein